MDFSVARKLSGQRTRAAAIPRRRVQLAESSPTSRNPQAFVLFGGTQLRSNKMLNQALGGLNPLFQEGGPPLPAAVAAPDVLITNEE